MAAGGLELVEKVGAVAVGPDGNGEVDESATAVDSILLVVELVGTSVRGTTGAEGVEKDDGERLGGVCL